MARVNGHSHTEKKDTHLPVWPVESLGRHPKYLRDSAPSNLPRVPQADSACISPFVTVRQNGMRLQSPCSMMDRSAGVFPCVFCLLVCLKFILHSRWTTSWTTEKDHGHQYLMGLALFDRAPVASMTSLISTASSYLQGPEPKVLQ